MRAMRLLPAIFLLVGFAKLPAGTSTPNEYVRLEVRPAMQSLRPGASGVIEFYFAPVDGIHINADPPVQFILDPGTALTLQGKTVVTTDAKTGYLSAGTPVKQAVTLGEGTRPGELKVRGTLVYFFCSDSEGWCNRQKEPVEFILLVKP